jgi:hypothetical protein
MSELGTTDFFLKYSLLGRVHFSPVSRWSFTAPRSNQISGTIQIASYTTLDDYELVYFCLACRGLRLSWYDRQSIPGEIARLSIRLSGFAEGTVVAGRKFRLNQKSSELLVAWTRACQNGQVENPKAWADEWVRENGEDSGAV